MIRAEFSLPLIVAAIIAFGLVVLSSAAPDSSFVRQQVVYLGVAVVACAVLWWVGKARILKLAPAAYVVSIFLLILTHFFGTETYGAKRWLQIGFLPGFQPSELAKLALVLVLAMTLHERPIRRLGDYVRIGVLVGIPFTLVFLEPDLGTALVMLAIGSGIALVRGLPLKHVIVMAVLLGVAAPTVVLPNLKPHQKERIVAFLDPGSDPQGSGYQVIQSRIAIGSGGLTGKGLGQGTQAQLGFIPFSHTDFIYPVIAEEWGFLGAMTILILYGLLFAQLAAMAAECQSERDRFIIVGVLSLIGFQVFVNVGVSLGLAPVTGITLPLVSYGGTSLLATMLALTLAFVVYRDRFADW